MAALLNTCISTGYVLSRWKTVANAMLEKIPGVPKINKKLRVIHVLEADLNFWYSAYCGIDVCSGMLKKTNVSDHFLHTVLLELLHSLAVLQMLHSVSGSGFSAGASLNLLPLNSKLRPAAANIDGISPPVSLTTRRDHGSWLLWVVVVACAKCDGARQVPPLVPDGLLVMVLVSGDWVSTVSRTLS
jgi:hypothetical protein